MRRARTLIAALLVLLISGHSSAQTVRCTSWNLEWFPNGSAKEVSAAQQEQRMKRAADVLRPIDPDILLLQDVRITTYVRPSVMLSRRAFITSQFALRSRSHSKAV